MTLFVEDFLQPQAAVVALTATAASSYYSLFQVAIKG
jgi:hypothetical protein